MKPHISSAETGGPRAIGLGLLLAVIACHDEFASEPVTIVPVDPAALEVSTMMVRDTDTIVVRLADRRASIAGIGIHWTSSNSSLLELRSIPPAGNSRSDSLEAQIRIQAIAHQHGRAVITATIDQLGITAIAIEDTVTVLERWAAVTAGGGYTCGLTIEQDAYCWGGVPIGLAPTSFGLGNGASNGSDRPMQVIGGYKFTILSAGDDQTCGATAPLGLLYCWGRNVWGELGNGSLDNSLIPTVVVGGRRFRQVITKTGLTCGVISDAFLTVEGHRRNTLCWGRSSLGEIGNENVTILTEEEAPVCGEGRYRFQCILKPFYTVTFPEEEDFVLGSVSVGGDFACGIAQSIGRLVEGSVWCWGLNDQSQLGQETAVGECRVWGDNDQFPPSPVPCNIDPVQVIGGLSFKALSSGRGVSSPD